MDLFRVFPWIDAARPGEPGHPLYVSTFQGRGRVDNPEHYLVLYAADAPEAAVAETFGNHSVWTNALFAGPPSMPGSRRAVAHYSTGDQVLDLDDPKNLVARFLRPSRVITRNREVTRAWALAIFFENEWLGVRWWSYYNADWGAFGLWGRSGVSVVDVTPLSRDHPAVVDAAHTLGRRVT